MITILFIMAVVLSGAIGYFIAYLQNEKRLEEDKKKSERYNPYASLGHFSW